MRVLLTGGAGFIGANLVRRLAGGSHRCVVLDDLSTGAEANLERLDVELVRGTVSDMALVTRLVARCDAVVHLAGVTGVPPSLEHPRRTHDVNVTGTINVLEAARAHGDRHVVFASSAAVYGPEPAQPQREDLVPAPTTPYAASKLAAEQYALAYQASFGVPVLALRFFNVYGPLQAPGHGYAAVIPAFLSAALAGHPLVIHGDGMQTRDFTYVDTVVAVLADALDRKVVAPAPLNLASGRTSSLLDVVTAIEGAVGHPLERQHTPSRPGDVRHSHADTTALRALFPDRSAFALDEGVRQTLEWFRRTWAENPDPPT